MLAMLRRANPYFPPGTWVECFDDGCRRVEVTTENNRLVVVKEIGMLYPKATLVPYMMKLRKTGLDRDN